MDIKYLASAVLMVVLLSGYQAGYGQPGIPGGPDLALPSAPRLVAPAYGASDTGLDLSLQWDEETYALSYMLQLDVDPQFGDPVVYQEQLGETNYMVENLDPLTTYYWRVRSVGEVTESDWSEVWHFTTQATDTGTDTDESLTGRADSWALMQNYPNPFNPATRIQFKIPEPAAVTLTVYNAIGQEVALLVDETRPAGLHNVVFDASGLPGGTYIYRLQADSFSESRIMTVIP